MGAGGWVGAWFAGWANTGMRHCVVPLSAAQAPYTLAHTHPHVRAAHPSYGVPGHALASTDPCHTLTHTNAHVCVQLTRVTVHLGDTEPTTTFKH